MYIYLSDSVIDLKCICVCVRAHARECVYVCIIFVESDFVKSERELSGRLSSGPFLGVRWTWKVEVPFTSSNRVFVSFILFFIPIF